ncbi:MAG: hypothetical protein IT443_04415 [Phycisphaeraceae bacterium]|nr:hypothetical protein [Phycisphaeraceae bacterium]
MRDGEQTVRFAWLAALAWMTLLAGGVGGLLYGSAARLFADDHARQAVAVGTVLVYSGAVLGLIPAAATSAWGLMPTVFGYFFGSAVRLVWTVAGLALAIKGYGISTFPLAVTVVVIYVLLLIMESALVGRYLWQKDLAGTGSGPRGREATA